MYNTSRGVETYTLSEKSERSKILQETKMKFNRRQFFHQKSAERDICNVFMWLEKKAEMKCEVFAFNLNGTKICVQIFKLNDFSKARLK